MITRTEAERVAVSINAIRPDWPIASLTTLITRDLADWPLLDAAVGLMHVAIERSSDGRWMTNTPARVKENGPWRRVGNLNGEAEQARLRANREYRERLDSINVRGQAVRNCHLCDDRGYALRDGQPTGYICQHVDRAATARRGAAAARAAIRPVRA